MARAVKVTFREFRTLYSTEDACRAELFRLRFPNGFVCPACGRTEYYPVRGRNTFQYRSCRRQTSVTAGTVMHRTHPSAADRLVLGDLPGRLRQAGHLCTNFGGQNQCQLRNRLVSFEADPHGYGNPGCPIYACGHH